MPELITLWKWRTWVVVLCFSAVFGLISYYESALNLPAPKPLSVSPAIFSEERTRHFLRKYEAIGVKTVGAVPQEQQTVELIVDSINHIKEDMKRDGRTQYTLDIDVQQASGDYFYFRRGIMTYQNVSNVIVRLAPNITHTDEEEAYRFRRNGILVSAHWDSALGSPGVSDDGANIAAMVELIRNLVFTPARGNSSHLTFPIIFNFNGAEEAGLLGAHGFVTSHKWSKQVAMAINLEAIGSGGPAILFQSGPQHAWMVKALAAGAPYPEGNVLAQDLFQSDKIPGDTDYRVYRDVGGIPGLDIAFYHRGYVYHSKQDIEDKIDPGSLQHLGENILGLLLHLLHNPKPHKKPYPYWLETNEPLQRAVFYTIPGLGMVVYNMETAKLIQSIAATIAILLLTRLSFGDHFRRPTKKLLKKKDDDEDSGMSTEESSADEDTESEPEDSDSPVRRRRVQKKPVKRRHRTASRPSQSPAHPTVDDGLIGGVKPPPGLYSMFGGICTFTFTLIVSIAVPAGIGMVLSHPSLLNNPMPWYHWEPSALLLAFGLPSVLGIFLVHRLAQQPSVPILTTGSVIYHSALTFWVTILLLGTVNDVGAAYLAYWNVAALSLPPVFIVIVTKFVTLRTRTKRNLLWWMLLICAIVPFMLTIHVTIMFSRLFISLTGRAVYQYPDVVTGAFCGALMFLCLSPIMALQNNDPVDDLDIDESDDSATIVQSVNRSRVGRVSTVLAALVVFSGVSLLCMSNTFAYSTTIQKRSMIQHELRFAFSPKENNTPQFQNSTLIFYGSDGHRVQQSLPIDILSAAVTTTGNAQDSDDKFVLDCNYRFIWVPSSVIRANATACDAYILPRQRNLIAGQSEKQITSTFAPELSVVNTTTRQTDGGVGELLTTVIQIRNVHAFQTQVDVFGNVLQLSTPHATYFRNNEDHRSKLKCNTRFSPYTELDPRPCSRVLHLLGGEHKGTWRIVVEHQGPVSVEVVSTYGSPITEEIKSAERVLPVWMSSVNVVTSVVSFDLPEGQHST